MKSRVPAWRCLMEPGSLCSRPLVSPPLLLQRVLCCHACLTASSPWLTPYSLHHLERALYLTSSVLCGMGTIRAQAEETKKPDKLKGMFCLFSKTQNHLRREPDGHGAGGTSYPHLRSLGRPHPLHHLEDVYPKHQQRRKGTVSPASVRALECRLKADRVGPMPSSLR